MITKRFKTFQISSLDIYVSLQSLLSSRQNLPSSLRLLRRTWFSLAKYKFVRACLKKEEEEGGGRNARGTRRGNANARSGESFIRVVRSTSPATESFFRWPLCSPFPVHCESFSTSSLLLPSFHC